MAHVIRAWRALPASAFVAAGVTVAIVLVAAARLALSGWWSVAPDDARYLFVGMSLLEGDGPVTPGGNVFLLRSPVYGLALALGGTALGGDPIVGAHLVAWALGIIGFIGALRLGWLLGGPGGAAGVAIALLATPLLWRLLPSMRIDLVQTAGVVAVLLLAWRPTLRRWIAAGVVFGLTILVKETVIPLALLPVALVGFERPTHIARLAIGYATAALVTAGWWWIVVWARAGVIFPLNAIDVIEARDVAAAIRLDWFGLGLIVTIAVAWTVVAIQARNRPGARLLVIGAACLVPAAAYATQQGLNARNYAGLAVLSAVAIGTTGAWLVRAVRGRARDGDGATRPGIVAVIVVLALLAGLAGAGAVTGQRLGGTPTRDPLADRLAGWLRDRTEPGTRIAMTFRYREITALRLFGLAQVAGFQANRIGPEDDPADYLWLGLRDQQLFGYRRDRWLATLSDPPVAQVVLAGPHVFTPDELLAPLVAGEMPALRLIETLEDTRGYAVVFAVDRAALSGDVATPRLRLTGDAALAWLDLTGGATTKPDPEARLVDARPLVSGAGVSELLARLGDRVCAQPRADGTVELLVPGACAP